MQYLPVRTTFTHVDLPQLDDISMDIFPVKSNKNSGSGQVFQ